MKTVIKKMSMNKNSITLLVILTLGIALSAENVFARDVLYNPNDGEVEVMVNPGEPTQVTFPGKISGGYKKKNSMVSIDRKGSDLIIFAHQHVTATGEAFIVRLEDGRSYSIRAKRTSAPEERDEFVTIQDDRGGIILQKETPEPAYAERNYRYAPASKVSGFMRELALNSEFGKSTISGYQRSEKYKGEIVLDDGAILATIDSIYIGSQYWGYVINAQNRLDTTQKVNPATFRIDGTRAISMSNWELAPRPFNVEQQIAGKDQTKIYIVTKARK